MSQHHIILPLLSPLKVKQDLIRTKHGATIADITGSYYGTTLRELVKLKTKQELAQYLVDDNPNVRTAAKLLIEEQNEA